MSEKTVMIVDDAKLMRLMLKQIVESGGYKVVADLENGEELLQQYPEHRPDLVLLDVIMPKMNGIEALEKVLQIDPGANVIMVSSAGKESNINKSRELGAKNFIIKPFDQTKVLDIMKLVVGS